MPSADQIKLACLGLALAFFWACADDPEPSDDDDDDGGSASTTSGGGGSTTTGTTAGSGGMAGSTSSSGGMVTSSSSTGMGSQCETACTTIYNCGVDMGRCPGFATLSLMDFNNGTMNDGCIATCDGNPLLIALVNPNDCDTTITNLRSASTDFAVTCDGQ